MRVAVLGSAGMLGSALVKELNTSGHDCVEFSRDRGFDLRDPADQRRAMTIVAKDCVAVYDCAARVGGIASNAKDQYGFLVDNVRLAMTIDAARRAGVHAYFYISSSCVFPTNLNRRLHPSDVLTGPLELTNEGYALAKIVGMQMCKYIRYQFDLNYKTFILPNLYGPGDDFSADGHVLAATVAKVVDAMRRGDDHITLWGDGSARREFLHVSDAANAMVRIGIGDLAAEYAEPSAVNVGVNYDIAISELAEIVKSMAKVPPGTIATKYDLSMPNGAKSKLLDSVGLQRVGWMPRVRFTEGVLEMIEEYRRKYVV